jgi:hypothetical protein
MKAPFAAPFPAAGGTFVCNGGNFQGGQLDSFG